jgi:hypothetical protein
VGVRAWCSIGVALVASGCFVETRFEDTRFACPDGKCPDGFRCVEERCEPERDGGTGGPQDAALLSCEAQFGEQPGYQLCAEEPTSCEFFTITEEQAACRDICDAYGVDCVDGFDAEAAAACTREAVMSGCDALHISQICLCSRSVAES